MAPGGVKVKTGALEAWTTGMGIPSLDVTTASAVFQGGVQPWSKVSRTGRHPTAWPRPCGSGRSLDLLGVLSVGGGKALTPARVAERPAEFLLGLGVRRSPALQGHLHHLPSHDEVGYRAREAEGPLGAKRARKC